MNRFEVIKPSTLAQAKDLVQEKAWSQYKAGGIDVIDHLKEHLEEPPRIVHDKQAATANAARIRANTIFVVGAKPETLLAAGRMLRVTFAKAIGLVTWHPRGTRPFGQPSL